MPGRATARCREKGGFRLSLFGAQPLKDLEAIVREHGRRRVDLLEVDRSLLLSKATVKVPHGGGKRTSIGSLEHESYPLSVQAAFADGSSVDVTPLCTFSSLDASVVTLDAAGGVTAVGIGGAAMIVRFRAEPVLAQIIVAREGASPCVRKSGCYWGD
jgi:hypothetical protein